MISQNCVAFSEYLNFKIKGSANRKKNVKKVGNDLVFILSKVHIISTICRLISCVRISFYLPSSRNNRVKGCSHLGKLLQGFILLERSFNGWKDRKTVENLFL